MLHALAQRVAQVATRPAEGTSDRQGVSSRRTMKAYIDRALMLSVPQHVPARHSLGYLHAPILHAQSCQRSSRAHTRAGNASCKATATDVMSTDCVVIGSGVGGKPHLPDAACAGVCSCLACALK